MWASLTAAERRTLLVALALWVAQLEEAPAVIGAGEGREEWERAQALRAAIRAAFDD